MASKGKGKRQNLLETSGQSECCQCYKIAPLDCFYTVKVSKHSPTGIDTLCKECRKKNTKERRLQNPRQTTDYQLKWKFGISLEDYERREADQQGLCLICRRKEFLENLPARKRLSVDHKHGTDEIRGLLCTYCNTGLGFFDDDPEIIKRAISYLENNSGVQ